MVEDELRFRRVQRRSPTPGSARIARQPSSRVLPSRPLGVDSMSLGTSKRVLLLEFNEITWAIIDPLIASGKLPNLARLLREGTVASPEALEKRPHLDPWVTWVTVHTGAERSVHGATVLEQDSA